MSFANTQLPLSKSCGRSWDGSQYSDVTGDCYPDGAAINTASGQFMWTPTVAPAANSLNILVSDNGVLSLSATQRFVVTVSEQFSAVTYEACINPKQTSFSP